MQHWFHTLFAAALMLLASSCRAPDSAPADLAQHQEALDFATGSIAGGPLWHGVPLADLDGAASLASRTLFASVRDAGGQRVGYAWPSWNDGTFSIPNIAVGSYDLRLHESSCEQLVLAETSLVVSPGLVTSADVELSTSSGLVIGTITVNGQPLAYPNIGVGYCGTFGTDESGQFASPLPPGTYAATVRSGDNLVGTFDFTVIAGQVTDVGTVAFDSGSIAGGPLWHGVPVADLDGAASLASRTLFASVRDAGGQRVGYSWPSWNDGTFSIPNIAVGSYDLRLHESSCEQLVLAETSLVVSPGLVTSADVELSTSSGLVIGAITVNGQPLAYPNIGVGYCGNFGTDEFGQFASPLPPGTYAATVRSGDNLVGTFDFTVIAGQITDVGTVAFDSGSIAGGPLWHGVPVADLDGAASLASRTLFASVRDAGGQRVGDAWPSWNDGTFSIPNIAVGSYDLRLHESSCEQLVLAETSLVVSPGLVTSADVELSTSSGLVIGTITVNGQPLAYPNIGVGYCGNFGTDEFGQFASPLPPGTYAATVRSGDNLVGTFEFTVIAGQITDVDIGTTPAGTDVFVELSGGTDTPGGISLLFSEITQTGQTTVVESGAGPPPDTGFRIVGLQGEPRYWDINTTAGYVGTITVCISYDESQVGGNESNLQLRHDDGSGWDDITTSIDTDLNIICGSATSLSPFAVFEPLDSDGDGDPDLSDACPQDPSKTSPGTCGCGTADTDTDGDGTADCEDPCPDDAQNDSDVDGWCDSQDNCPAEPNPDQADGDSDGIGDACEVSDTDGDGVSDASDACPGTSVGAIVDASGCSLDDHCPCDGSWKNEGAYLKCGVRFGRAFVRAGILERSDVRAWLASAKGSQCWRRPASPRPRR